MFLRYTLAMLNENIPFISEEYLDLYEAVHFIRLQKKNGYSFNSFELCTPSIMPADFLIPDQSKMSLTEQAEYLTEIVQSTSLLYHHIVNNWLKVFACIKIEEKYKILHISSDNFRVYSSRKFEQTVQHLAHKTECPLVDLENEKVQSRLMILKQEIKALYVGNLTRQSSFLFELTNLYGRHQMPDKAHRVITTTLSNAQAFSLTELEKMTHKQRSYTLLPSNQIQGIEFKEIPNKTSESIVLTNFLLGLSSK